MQTIQGFKLSPQQKYLWLLQQDSQAYCAQCAIQIEGNLQTEALKAALEKISDRHEILRTTFPRKTGIKIPIQVIADRSSFSWQSFPLEGLTSEEKLAKIKAILQEDKRSHFNLEQNPVWRLSLITLSADSHILVVSLPSLCADTRSLKNLVREISQHYAACLHNHRVCDEEIVQYVQFSEWQNEVLEDEESAEGKKHWNEQNYSTLASLKLPFENKFVGGLKQFEPDCFEVKIDRNLVEKIEAIARNYNSSLSTFLLACWKTLLWRLTGKSDIIVATAFDGRKYEELEPALGLFAKFLPLHTQLQDNFTFREIWQQVHKLESDRSKLQEYFSQEEISESVDFFPVCFEFDERVDKYSVADVFFSIYQQYFCSDRFKVKLSCLRRDDSLIAEFHYDPASIGEAAIRCMAEQFQTLVASASSNPETAISQLEILSDRARQQILVEFNNLTPNLTPLPPFPTREGGKDSPPLLGEGLGERLIHQLFEEQAKRSPDNIAVVFETQQITYRELNARANQIAHYLQKLGVKPEVLVAIFVDRSSEAIAAMLGILKAGGAYLPLDPAMPKDRLALMLQDAGVLAVLTQQQLIENLPETQAHIVCLERDWDAKSPTPQASLTVRENDRNLDSGATRENLAYVIYTSGSTGNPKGVAIAHQQLLNYLYAIQERLNLPTGASFAIVSTLAADLGNTAIFPALCAGGCLHVISQERATDPEAIAAYFQQHSIDCLKIVPSHLKALLNASTPAHVLPKKRLILGGEALNWQLIDIIQKYAPNCSIFNHYGPTETTVGVLTYRITQPENRLSETVPIGRPLNNVQIYLLDAQLQPVAIGVPGELYIGGDCLARGYLDRPELTKEKFIPNPFSQEPGKRLYKTGDLARYLPDGNIEFLGRIDNQVKLRGFRIELGEIEAVLRQHPSVREALILLRESEPENQRLIAYIVPKRESATAINDLRSFLKEKLPEYMVPSAFVTLKALPLTSNGKIDRQALPAPETVKSDLADTFVAPRTASEKLLADIWAELLGLEKVGIYDNFFDLGGHSLLVTQLLAKVRSAFQIELPLRRLFEAPTVADLAKSIEMNRGADSVVERDSTFDINAEAVLDSTIRPDTLFGEHLTFEKEPNPPAPFPKLLGGEFFPPKSFGEGVATEFSSSVCKSEMLPLFVEPATQPARIFLTGANGFLGAFLLRELLQQTKAEIYYLVRSSDAKSGKQRIQSSLEAYLIWEENYSDRIIPVVGDLSKPLLGLSDEQFRVLADLIDVIYHNGAFVKFTYPYSYLKAANVLGTQEILRLASQIKVKPVHFISTISVFSAVGESGVKVVREQDALTPGETLEGAYAQSKWVAEKLVEIARDRGIPVSIYRPGRISGNSQTGACNPNDLLYRLIIGCVQLGCAPDIDSMMNVAPVDYVSRAIAHLSQQTTSLNQTFHLVNPHSFQMSELIGWIRSMGYPIERISYENWQAEIRDRAGNSPENALYPLVDLFSQNDSQAETSPSATLQFDCQNTLDKLSGTDITCPPADANLFQTYFSHLVDRGLIKTP